MSLCLSTIGVRSEADERSEGMELSVPDKGDIDKKKVERLVITRMWVALFRTNVFG